MLSVWECQGGLTPVCCQCGSVRVDLPWYAVSVGVSGWTNPGMLSVWECQGGLTLV